MLSDGEDDPRGQECGCFVRRDAARMSTSSDTIRAAVCLVCFCGLSWHTIAGQSLTDETHRSTSSPARSDLTYFKGKVASDFQLISGVRWSSSRAPEMLDLPMNGNSESANSALIQHAPESQTTTRQNWGASSRESLLFTGIMHTFNLWTEAGTRDTLNGHWLDDYLHSIGELRGWSDGDTFMSPYVGHTIEGSVFGYIQRQNDPKYRLVQWGDGRDYFMSLLRSMAYSAVWHAQWKIGPVSEASIGNVMLHASPGFITLTDTPTLGTVAMIAEDTADRYLLMGLENRTANRPVLVLARSFLNPGRSFANLMAFRVPWHRDTRIGLFGRNFRTRQQLLEEYSGTGERAFTYISPLPEDGATRIYPKEAPIELSAFPVFEKLGDHGCIGGGGSGAVRVTPRWQALAQLNGCLVRHMPAANESGDSLFYGGGVRWTPRAARRFSPFFQVLFGGKKVTYEVDDIALRTKLMAEWNNGSGTLPHYPRRSEWSAQIAHNGPTLAFAGGCDL